ncbi:MAG: hypothetical protein M3H12_02615 [Chromatiales bacterium]|nr:hypothetical protein [Gammaproteobacteria bacterium]
MNCDNNCDKCNCGNDDLATTPYSKRLAGMVYQVARDNPEIRPIDVEQIIVEALRRVALDLREGRAVDLEYLGTLSPVKSRVGRCTFIHFEADPELTTPQPPVRSCAMGTEKQS